MASPLLEVRNLRTHFFTDEGVVKAVDDVSFSVERGKTLGIVGESGCGKSITAMSIMGLVSPPGRIIDGEIWFRDEGTEVDLAKLSDNHMRRWRGRRIAMIFQEPMTSLNPVFSVGAQIVEVLRQHLDISKTEARNRTIELLGQVRLPSPEQRIDEYPHQFSGGMRQRVMIAMALACNPQLLIADEPTTALDVTIQAQILELLRDLQAETGMTIMIITHDLGVIAEMADDVVVMYASKVVEQASAVELFQNPLHPYTRGLLASRPSGGMTKDQRLVQIPGMVPSPLRLPTGCKFHPRCPIAEETCSQAEPSLAAVRPNHLTRCPVVASEAATATKE